MPQTRSRPPLRIAGVSALLAGMLLGVLAASAPRPALAVAPAAEPEFRRHVESLVASGELDVDDALLARVQRVFAPEELPPALASPGTAWPAKSAFGLLLDVARRHADLPPELARRVDDALASADGGEPSLHLTAHFRFAYRTDGPDAVPPADIAPANGVPDFVERAAEAAETAHARYAATGFPLPDQRVAVSFRAMEAFGYTVLVDGAPAIVLHHDYVGFPENRDPVDSRLGALEVSIAHELKHVSQWLASGWVEGGWLEADATWAEDFVFDEVDDYLRYLPFGSPVSHPQDWMPPSYEDCLWSQLLAQEYGPGILVEFFDRRGEAPGEPVLASYDRVLAGRGSGLARAVGTLGVWCNLTGANAGGRPEGFADAGLFPTPPLSDTLLDPGASIGRDLPALGSHQILVGGPDREGRPRISFVGSGHAGWAVHAVVLGRDGLRRVETIPLAAAHAATHEVELPWDDVQLLHVVVSRTDPQDGLDAYTLTVDDQSAVGVIDPAAGPAFRLAPARPNPFRTSTALAFELPRDATVRLAIYDVAGRIVRHLVDGRSLPAGRHEVSWDGADEGGRAVAPGVYWIRLEAGDRTAAGRTLRLR